MKAAPRPFCIGHRAPLFEPPLDFTMVTPVGLGGRQEVVIGDDYLGDPTHGRVLSEYLQLFGLSDRLQGSSGADSILLFQYRKFLSLMHPARRSTNIPFAFVATPDEARDYCIGTEAAASIEARMVVGPVLRVESLTADYARYHVAEDFDGLLRSMRGWFPAATCQRFADCELLVPAPSLGLFEIGPFVRHMSLLREVWCHFHTHHFVERSGYQRRVGGFLLERLHSFLLLEELAGIRREEVRFGHQVIVSDDAVVQPTV